MSNEMRTLPIYLVSGLMALFSSMFGAFFLIWCGTLRFLFVESTAGSIVLLLFPGLIAWMSYHAARDAWQALPDAPLAAIRVLVVLAVFFIVTEFLMWQAKEIAGFSIWLLLPFAIIAGLVWMVYLLSHHFQGHLLEIDTPFVEESPYASDSHDDDDDWMFLGGA